ncbi:MAG: hypothetical protein U1A78_11415 [Polyangia bacterium]
MGNNERTKLSWREIDKARDGSGRPNRAAASSGRPAGRSEEDQRQKQYRAALEAAFEKGELGKLAEKLNVVRGISEEPARPAPVVATPVAPSTPNAAEAAEGAAAAGGDEAAGARGGKKKPGEDKATLLRKFLEASTQKDISRNAERYLARFPLPDDHEFLEQLLEHEKEARVREALTRISELLDRRHMPKRTRALIGKLRYLTETSSSDELRERAGSLLQRIK